MTTYSAFAPVTPSISGTQGGPFCVALEFTLSQDMALVGIWHYSPPAATALPASCGIFDSATELVVSGTENDSPSWSGAAGSGWVECAYDGSVTLVANKKYKVATVADTADIWEAYTLGYFASADVVSGPITMLSQANSTLGQASYTTVSSPKIAWPDTASVTNAYWVDIAVSPLPGSNVRLWPFTTPSGGALAAGTSTFGTEFEVSTQQGIYAVWYYSAPGAAVLPSACGVWDIDSQTIVAENLSPTWSGAAGSGWVSCAFPGTDLVNPGTHYATSIYASSTSGWRYHTPSYWTTGAGASGISDSQLSAPSTASSVNGQSVALTGSFGFPNTSGAGQNFWVDVEVGAPIIPVPGHISVANALVDTSSIAESAPTATTANAPIGAVTTKNSSPSASSVNQLVGSATAGNGN
jgi:hypothetical protein